MQAFDLNAIHVKSPCTVPWETMIGDERTRFCAQCRLNVFNLSDMTKAEAEALVRNKEGRLCVGYVRRADGTIMTRECMPEHHVRLSRWIAIAVACGIGFAFQLFALFGESPAAWKASGRKHGSASLAMERMRNSSLYRNSRTAKAVVEWTDKQLPVPPEPMSWGMF